MSKRTLLVPFVALALMSTATLVSCAKDDSTTTTTTTTTTTETATQSVSTTALTDATSDELSAHSFNNTVKIVLNGTSATVTGDVSGVTITNASGIINITSTASGVDYVLSGSYTGSVNIVSSEIAKVTLSGATITNTSGVALNLAAPKAFVVSTAGTTNTLTATPPPRDTQRSITRVSSCLTAQAHLPLCRKPTMLCIRSEDSRPMRPPST